MPYPSNSRFNPINVDNDDEGSFQNVSYLSSGSTSSPGLEIYSPTPFEFSAASCLSGSSFTSVSGSNFSNDSEFFVDFGDGADAMSVGSVSPAPSVYSLTESLRASSTKEEHGRGVNCYSDVYRLPADREEWSRLGEFFQVMTVPNVPVC